MSFEKGEGKEHLDKEFLEELKHKIWSTKGSRFAADTRLKTTAFYSGLGNSFLSGYLILFGLLYVYNLNIEKVIREDLLAFLITGVSIMSLVFSLIESSKNYLLRANSFHDCALELSRLYNELQTFKTYRIDADKNEIIEFVDNLQNRYQTILEKYENHSDIDHKYFRIKHTDYYKKITKSEVRHTKFLYFMGTKIIYLLMMIVPVIAIILILLYT